MEDYQAAIQHILCQCPDLKNYLQLYVLPAPGDWPTWFYQKKLIAQCSNSSNILSIIPEQGPFHVFLNLQEDIVKMYHFILGTVYHQIFGSDLPLKPKPFQINILITAVFLGWLKIRSKVHQKFKLCKDVEYASLLHLFEEVIPLGFFHYSLIFRSGDLEGYVKTMLQLLILFIIFDSTVDSKVLPLAYTNCKSSPAADPDATKVCDYSKCNIVDSTFDAIRLPCFHTIHKLCFNLVGKKCPICTSKLHSMINNLATAFNESLLKPTSKSNIVNQDNSEDGDHNNDSSNDNIHVNHTINPAYYSSSAWESQIDKELDTFTVPQPSAHNNTSSTSSQPTASQSEQQPVSINIQIARVSLGSSRFWFLPPHLSQATLFGRNGSNACTFISLLLAKKYTTSLQYATLQLNCNSDLNQAWLSLMLSAIATGNQIYDHVTQTQGLGNPFFSVAAAKDHFTAVMAPVTLEETLDLSITSVDPQIPQSSLSFYLQRLVRERNLAALVIVNGMTVCFVGQNNKVYFMDSHPHSYGRVFGAMVGMAPQDKLEEFLLNIKQQISPNFNVCSLSFASF